MAKVGRASRNASLMRVETLTASKTITSAETGELYLINHNAGSVLAVTLPAVKAGAYFKFIVIADMTTDAAGFSITTADGAGTLQGVCTAWEAADFSGAVSELDGGSSSTLTIGVNAEEVHVGSSVECHCDGTNWYLIGTVIRAAGGSGGDAVAWS
jgi:hypothetical protein